jgi:hypothetical protein
MLCYVVRIVCYVRFYFIFVDMDFICVVMSVLSRFIRVDAL